MVVENANQSSDDFASLLEENLSQKEFKRGSLIEGKVALINPDSVYVDLGGKYEGILNKDEIKIDNSEEMLYKVGDSIEAMITSISDEKGEIRLSYHKANQQKAKYQLEENFKNKVSVKAKVTKRNKGGFEAVLLETIRAFVPYSHIDMKVVPDDNYYLGQEFEFQIMSLDISKRRTNIVLTRRGLLEKEMANKEAEAWEQIEVGAILAGKVKNILDFGAFIDLGGIDGLVHLTEISWQKIKHPSDSVNVGQDVHVKVIKMDTENKKISLSIKETKEDPWIKEIEQFEVSQIIKGKVVNLTTYGAFVQISDNVTGLVKIPDLSWDKGVKKPSDILNNGEEVETKVLGIDTQSKKISLGIKQAQGDPWVNAESDFPQDSNHNVKVLRITNFGVFVELRPGLEGLIRKNDLGSKKSTEVKPGITLNAKVIHVDTESRKIDLSVRSLELEGEVQEMEDYMSKDGSSPAKKKPQKQGGSLGSFGSLLDELYSNSKNLKDNE